MNQTTPCKQEVIRARPAAYAVRLNKTPEEWNVWAGSWFGAQFLGRGTTEQEAWEQAAKTANGPKTRTVRCRNCYDQITVSETAPHPGFCQSCKAVEKRR